MLSNPLQTSGVFLFILFIGLAILNEEKVPEEKVIVKAPIIKVIEKEVPMRSTQLRDPKTIEKKNYNLAFSQSNGFFDDITNEHWKLMQKITRETWPNHFTGDITKYSSENNDYQGKYSGNWYNQNFHEEFHCTFAQRIPSHKERSGPDGAKWVCDPHRIAKQKDCLVYSVGSNGNPMFEEGVKSHIGQHCEVHTFDVRASTRLGDFAKKLEGLSTFHHWGLGTQAQSDAYKKRGTGFPMKTLEETIKELGHEGRRIDLFKIDCEGCEWDIHLDILKFDIRQIQIETHGAPLDKARSLFYSFHDAGYVITSKEPNFTDSTCIEFAFLKLSPKFFIEDSLYEKLTIEKS